MALDKFSKVLLILMALTLTVGFIDLAIAGQTVKTIENDFEFDNRFRPNENPKDIPISLAIPDGISLVDNFIVKFKGDFETPNTEIGLNFTLKEGGNMRSCSPNTITSPSVAVYGYEVRFDCTNKANNWLGKGRFDVNLHPYVNNDVRNFYGGYQMTYLNDLKADMVFGATDYFSSEDGQLIFVQLINSTGDLQPIDDAICLANVYNSDATTLAITNSPMTHTTDGLYHLHTNIVEAGVHVVSVQCYYTYDLVIKNVTSTSTTSGNYELLPTTIDYEFFSTTNDGDDYTNETSSVTSFGGTVEIRHDWENKHALINASEDVVNGDVVILYVQNLDDIGNTIYLHDRSGTTIYGSYVITSDSAFQFHNITIANAGSGIDQIYVSDLSQGGAHDIDWDYISIVTSTGGGWFGDPDVLNSISDLSADDDNYWQIVENSGDDLEVEFIASNITGQLNNSANILISAKWSEPTENLNVSIYNYSSSSWVVFPNQITYSTIETDFNNELTGTYTDYISGSNTVSVKIEGTATNTEYGFLEIEYLVGGAFESEGAFISNVKGGGEIHIINTTDVSYDVWSAPNRELTALNFDTTDEDAIWGYEDNVSVNLLTQFVNYIWNYTQRELTGFPFDVSVLNRVDATTPEVLIGGTEYQIGDTGKLSIRLIKSQGGEGEPEVSADCNGSILDPDDTLYVDKDAMTEYGEGIYTLDFSAPSVEGVYTYFIDCFAGNETVNRSYFTLNTFHISDLSDDVWTRNDRNLTYYESADETDYDLIQEVVWNRSVRDLTYYETANVTLGNSSIQAIGDAVWSFTGDVNNNILLQFGEKVQCYVKNLLGGDDEWAVEIASC